MNDEKDINAFKKAMIGVTPLKHEKRVENNKRPKARARYSRADEKDVLHESLESSLIQRDAIEQHGEEIAYCHPSLPQRTFKKLRRGFFSIEAETDLHGLTAAEAKIHLQEFIEESRTQRLGCVRVIHGKGIRSGPDGPVLKGLVQLWLSQWEDVLAFASTRARHGGSGAVYVLLRSRK
ncbi:MAG: DNA mismatch repair protein MutS [Rhodospirillaceae bacterium]|nr:DNA mismatch repair protein MutS [Rhodospirillaceae bacterium]